MNDMNERFMRGAAKLNEVDGEVGEKVVAPLGDLGRYIVEFAFGDIYCRNGLTLKERELITVGALTVMGREKQLRVHLQASLHVGLTPEQIEEAIIQTVPYAGFPTAINALTILKEITNER